MVSSLLQPRPVEFQIDLVQGECDAFPFPTPLAFLKTSPTQCVITVAAPMMALIHGGSLLLSDVIIDLVRDESAPTDTDAPVPLIALRAGYLWMTDSVLKGDRVNCRGVEIGPGQLFHSSGLLLVQRKKLCEFSAFKLAAAGSFCSWPLQYLGWSFSSFDTTSS